MFTKCGCRRYGTRLPSVPAAPEREPNEDAADVRAAQADPSRASVSGSSPEGGSPPALQFGGGSSGGRFVRLYPEGADPSQPWEPGTPSNESVLATQQIWDSLSRGQHTAYRVSHHHVSSACLLATNLPSTAHVGWQKLAGSIACFSALQVSDHQNNY